jgi:hypothetical protein
MILGHSIDEVRSQELVLSNPKPVVNYNAFFGTLRKTEGKV